MQVLGLDLGPDLVLARVHLQVQVQVQALEEEALRLARMLGPVLDLGVDPGRPKRVLKPGHMLDHIPMEEEEEVKVVDMEEAMDQVVMEESEAKDIAKLVVFNLREKRYIILIKNKLYMNLWNNEYACACTCVVVH